jgi:colanic acid/amylovoran biosynthesis protein
MENIKLYFHGGSGNHGCEAIVRSTSKVLSTEPILYSQNIEQDEKYSLDDICKLLEDKDKLVNKFSFKNIIAVIMFKFSNKIDLFIRNRKKDLLDEIKKGDICLSIGGDNYCYKGTDILGALNNNFIRKGAKTVLWGCSVEPGMIDKEVAEDLAKYSLITARESISYEALKKVNKNTTFYPDPAFQLDKIELPLPKGFACGNTVGINLSPLIIDCEKNKGITMENYAKLLEYIIDKTDMQIALIPHVVWDNSDDRVPLMELYKRFEQTKRVVLINDCNCMELKGFISKCRMFIGARTHATIAAYSSCIPTIVVGYSVKARGIAKDIFGTYKNYVIPVQSLEEVDSLTNIFKWLVENEIEIKEHLNSVMPNYCEQALLAKVEIDKLIF